MESQTCLVLSLIFLPLPYSNPHTLMRQRENQAWTSLRSLSDSGYSSAAALSYSRVSLAWSRTRPTGGENSPCSAGPRCCPGGPTDLVPPRHCPDHLQLGTAGLWAAGEMPVELFPEKEHKGKCGLLVGKRWKGVWS